MDRIIAEIKRPLVSMLVGAVTLGIAVNAGTELLVGLLGRAWTVTLAGAATAAIIALAHPTRALGRFLRERLRARVSEIGEPVRGYRGLIVLASPPPGISSAEAAIRHHLASGRLEHCWLVTGGQASEAAGNSLVEKLVAEGVPLTLFHRLPLDAAAADNPEAVYRRVGDAYTEAVKLGIPEQDVMADYTGGTKSMTAGMILAAASPRRNLQFMKPRRYTPDGRAEPGIGADSVAVDIHFELIPGSQA